MAGRSTRLLEASPPEDLTQRPTEEILTMTTRSLSSTLTRVAMTVPPALCAAASARKQPTLREAFRKDCLIGTALNPGMVTARTLPPLQATASLIFPCKP